MSPQLLVFYAAAALALLGALLALTRTRPQAALRWFGLTLGALVVIEHQLIAPTIALLSLLFFAAAAAYLAVIAGHAEAAALAPLTAPPTAAAPSLAPPPASAPLSPPPAAAPRRLRRTRATYARALPLLAVAALAWVLTGTWARQHAWPGQELAPSAGFGGLSALTSALADPHLGALIAVVLLVLVAAVGGLALLGAGDGARR
ncbi:MAG: hypothetical protein IPK80_04870 [Nannocystis sp.]|nr:hypothetical protein [Nannocystis sp.]